VHAGTGLKIGENEFWNYIKGVGGLDDFYYPNKAIK